MGLMRKNMGLIACLLMMVTLIVSMKLGGVMAFKEFMVGDHQAWHVPDANDTSFYTTWAGNKRFHVGDSLRFEYQNDSVLAVDKYGYYHCDISKASSSFYDGKTIIKLENPGFVYFISGSVDHCRAGQRLEVDVMSPHPPHQPVASPPEAGHQALSPAAAVPSPAATAASGPTGKSSGVQLTPAITQVSLILGLLAASSIVF